MNPAADLPRHSLDLSTIYTLDKDNSIIVIKDVLSPAELIDFAVGLHTNKTQYGRKIFGHLPPRRQVVMTTGGINWFKNNTAQPYTPRDIHWAHRFHQEVVNLDPELEYRVLSNSNEIEYGPEFDRGGSIGKHQDNEKFWGLVIGFSYGQTRKMCFGKSGSGRRILEITVPSNSILAMYGPTFQETYWHEIPKLPKDVPPQLRVSFNSRWY